MATAKRFVVFNLFSLLASLFLLLHLSASSEDRASNPPRGWNSYDSFCWTISEEEFLQSAHVVSNRLHAFGYEYVVVDYLWYRRKVPGAYVDSLGYDVIDEWGRMIPDPGRWPSSKNGKGFTEVANNVHGMGLKFGIHVMRGISTQAVNANTPVLDITTGKAYEESGRVWRAQDIGLKERPCAWMPHGFMAINTKLGAGKAFLRSLYMQYAEWGVDFVKHDCVFGDDLDVNEISIVSEVLNGLSHPIVYSLSPGTSATPKMAQDISELVNMYRVTGDDWDTWGDVAAHFDVARDFASANLIGARGLLGRSWPDLDMLPLGYLTDPGSNVGPHRTSRLSLNEQRTQMTLWSIAKSPLMFGGDVRNIDDTTFGLITNPTLLEINSFSLSNVEFPVITSSRVQKSRGTMLSSKSTMYQSDRKESEMEVFVLTSCKDSNTNGWYIEELEQDLERICWKGSMKSRHGESFCLYKKHRLVESDEEMSYGSQYQGKLHLLASANMDFCLNASPTRKFTSSQFSRGSFSRCTWNANQMWEFHNGTLISSYSGLCSVVKKVKAKNDPGSVRAWIATGVGNGKYYLALFNLTPDNRKVVTAPASNFNLSGCTGKEEWSGQDLGIIKDDISIEVDAHGVALIVLSCKK